MGWAAAPKYPKQPGAFDAWSGSHRQYLNLGLCGLFRFIYYIVKIIIVRSRPLSFSCSSETWLRGVKLEKPEDYAWRQACPEDIRVEWLDLCVELKSLTGI